MSVTMGGMSSSRRTSFNECTRRTEVSIRKIQHAKLYRTGYIDNLVPLGIQICGGASNRQNNKPTNQKTGMLTVIDHLGASLGDVVDLHADIWIALYVRS